MTVVAGVSAAARRQLARLGAARPLPFELAAWTLLLIAVLFLRSHGLSIDWVTVSYTIPPLMLPTALGLLSGVGLQVIYKAARRRPLRPYLRTVASPGWLLLWLRIWVVCMTVSYGYIWLKVSIPLINYHLWDQLLWAADRFVHLGFSPAIFWRELLAGTGFLPWIDRWYSFWVSTIPPAIGFFCASARADVRRQAILCTVLLWAFGAWIYMAVPALGPVYVFSDVWEGVGEEMPGAQTAQAALWQNYQRVLAGREGTLQSFKPAFGVAAMPSLHVGAHFLILLWIRRWARPLLVPAVLAVIATFVGSVVTGWHYAVDGYVGLLLAWVVFRLAIALDRALEPAPPHAEATSGSAAGLPGDDPAASAATSAPEQADQGA